MKIIRKTSEPTELSAWKRRNPKGDYGNLTHTERQAIRKTCLIEQAYLCAYCCQRISEEHAINEHLLPQSSHPNHSLTFANIVASCVNKNQCDNAHKNQFLPLKPTDVDWENRFKYHLNGAVEGLDKQAVKVVKILNLGRSVKENRKLVEQRKQYLASVFLMDDLNDAEDDELVEMLIEDLKEIDKDGQLESFSPVAISFLKQKLKKG